MDFFDENIRYFESKNPRAAALLSLTNSTSLIITKTAANELNIKNSLFSYHDEHAASTEQERWRSSLPLQSIDVVYIFGIGLGYAYEVLRSWLAEDSSRNLIFLEDDLAVLSVFLESSRASHILKDPQVHVVHIENSEEGLLTIQSLVWGVYPKKILIDALPAYHQHRSQVFEEVKKRILYETAELHAILDEYMGFGVPFFRNFWKNVLLLPKTYRGSALFSRFSKIPAIVVGAGPSLQKHLPLLRALSDRALIFAGGSSVNVLTEAQIPFHFAAGIDPNPLQYLRLRQGSAFTTPFFYRNRLLHEALQMVEGSRLYLPGGDGYAIHEFFEKKLHIKGKVLGGGHSISNFLIEIAHALGCRPIIMVGYDLAFSQNKRYAHGVEEDVSFQQCVEDLNVDGPVPWKDIYGDPISTQWKWIVEAQWISEFQEKHPSLKLMNATEGGIGMTGVVNISFSKAVEKYLCKQYDLSSFVHREIEDCAFMDIEAQKILSLMAKIYDSLTRSMKLLDEMIQGAQLCVDDLYLEMPEGAQLFAALGEEDAFCYILDVFYRMRVKLDYMQAQYMHHVDYPEASVHENKRVSARFLFLREVTIVNKLLIVQAVQEYMERGNSITAFHPKTEVVWM